MQSCQANFLQFIYANTEEVPNFDSGEFGDLGFASDGKTIKQTLALWKALNEKWKSTPDVPLPTYRRILPLAISMWNRLKGGVDIMSRYLKNVKANHGKLSPPAAIRLR
ncbi:hypothetical protein HDU96_005148 [Phlyctochytrium bullatum]|nr:hypothetical protein HDU96_005148 [Phlyctochytrium bullatum]